MKPYQLIIFDWDGTLMDSTQHIINCMQLGIEQLDLPRLSDSAVSHIIGLGLNEAVYALYPDLDATTRKTLGQHYQQNWLNSSFEAPLFDNAQNLIRKLSEQDLFLGVATGKSRGGLDKVLANTGLGQFFHATRCVDECHSKPHPQMVQELMDYLGVEAQHTLMIGDTSHDLQMAHNAGAHSLAISHGAHDMAALQACQPQAIVDDLYEVEQWLLCS